MISLSLIAFTSAHRQFSQMVLSSHRIFDDEFRLPLHVSHFTLSTLQNGSCFAFFAFIICITYATHSVADVNLTFYLLTIAPEMCGFFFSSFLTIFHVPSLSFSIFLSYISRDGYTFPVFLFFRKIQMMKIVMLIE